MSDHPERVLAPPVPASGPTIEVEINGETRVVPRSLSVADLLESLGMAGTRVAVAVDRAVVVRSRYRDFELHAGARIEILEAVGGG